MLAIVIGGIALLAGALVWYQVVRPFSYMLKESEELERGDWAGALASSKPPESMASSLANLSNALGNSHATSAASERKETVVPVG